MIRRRYLVARVVALLFVLQYAAGQEEASRYGPFVPTPEYRRAFRLVDEGDRAEGARLFREIAAQNPGTALGAESLFQAAYWSETASLRQAAYLAIIEGYPGSSYEVHARKCLAQIDHPGGSARLQAYDQLAQHFGGPALREILKRGDKNQVVSQFRRLPQEIQGGLVTIYVGIQDILHLTLRRKEDALQVALFNRQAFVFDEVASQQAQSDIYGILSEIKFGHPGSYAHLPSPPPQKPTVRVRYPRQGQRTGPRPRIRVECTVGDYRLSQVNLGTLEFTLDGQSLKPLMEVRSKIDTSLKLEQPFERLRLSARPAQPLSPGTHTILLRVPGGNSETLLSWTFVVAPGCEDEADDEDW